MKHWIEHTLAPKLGAGLMRALGATMRLQLHDPHGIVQQLERPAVLFSFWHNRLFLLPYFQNRFFPQRRLAAMISRSHDGNLISNIVHEFRIYAARGSSSKRGSAALLALRHWLQQGIDAAITPDGPRGPRQKLQPGILHLARTTGHVIVPLRIEYSHKFELKSWDRFQIPCPFARCDFHFGDPIAIRPDVSDEELAEITRTLTATMGE